MSKINLPRRLERPPRNSVIAAADRAAEPAATDRSCRSDSPPSIQLLVSVREFDEFELAWRTGVDLIDFKEPRDGPLAPVSAQLWQQAAAQLGSGPGSNQPEGSFAEASADNRPGRLPRLSAALGELPSALRIASAVPRQFTFAKAGPSDCGRVETLTRMWRELRCELDRSIQLVAVAYADHDQAGCPPPESIFAAAAESGLRYGLLDTFAKDGLSTIELLGEQRLRRIAENLRHQSFWWALAGSIKLEPFRRWLGGGRSPDCVALRGDVCSRDRTGRLRSRRIRCWQRLLAEHQFG